MGVKTYDPKKVIVSYMGQLLTGFADGTFITVELDEDGWIKSIGTDGEVARARNANEGGSATLTLMQTSMSNDVLSALLAADRLTGSVVGPFVVKDLSGATLAISPNTWIKKSPNIERAKEIGSCVWVFDTGKMIPFVGGTL